MVRTPWGVPNEEESRAYLQARLTLLFQLMFWAYALLQASMVVLYKGGFGVKEPIGQGYIFGIGSAALLLMATLWRGVLLRRTLSFESLQWLDSVYSLGSGLALGACAVFAYDYPPSHYITEIYAYIAVFGRTIIVPSSGPRSLMSSVMIVAPVAIAGVVIAAISDQLFLPRPVFASGGVVLNAVAALLGTQGSRIIYGLRRQVSAAQQLGAYKLERKIGEGGNGAVYLAHHITLRRSTAVKLLLPDRVGAENLERFER